MAGRHYGKMVVYNMECRNRSRSVSMVSRRVLKLFNESLANGCVMMEEIFFVSI